MGLLTLNLPVHRTRTPTLTHVRPHSGALMASQKKVMKRYFGFDHAESAPGQARYPAPAARYSPCCRGSRGQGVAGDSRKVVAGLRPRRARQRAPKQRWPKMYCGEAGLVA